MVTLDIFITTVQFHPPEVVPSRPEGLSESTIGVAQRVGIPHCPGKFWLRKRADLATCLFSKRLLQVIFAKNEGMRLAQPVTQLLSSLDCL